MNGVSDELAIELTKLQRRIVDEGKQVLLVVEGRSGRVMGRVINEFMNLLEPRGMFYTHFVAEDVRDPRTMLRFLAREPAKGVIGIYDRSWYSFMVSKSPKGKVEEDSIEMCRAFERYLVNNGVILVKFFLNISDDSLDDLAALYGTRQAGRATSFLNDDHVDPKRWAEKVAMPLIASTSTPQAPWDILDVRDLDSTLDGVVRTFISRVDYAITMGTVDIPTRMTCNFDNPRVHADLSLTAKGYKTELEELSVKVNRLQSRLAASERSLVLVFEGWDAAGKGGSIKRLVRALNPRGYYIRPVAAPAGDERRHTYLWRFTRDMPKAGHISLFDRSWYGRMMVEPIEGFCSEEEYERSAEEIRNFERFITESGGIVIKFWMEISSDEQLSRFNSRMENSFKRWKITDEDWRNREKWDTYCEYVDRMMEATNTPYAPWVVVESEDKKYGRLKVLRTVVETLERELE